MEKKTATGLEENIAGLLCYVLGWITGLVFLILEPQNRFIRFHAVQSIIVFGAITVVAVIIGWIPFVGWFISGVLGLIGFILWIVLMIKAYKGTMYKVPWAGNFAERYTAPKTT